MSIRFTTATPRQRGGHHFHFDTEVCAACGMTRRHYDDNGKPRCTGRRRPPERLPIPD